MVRAQGGGDRVGEGANGRIGEEKAGKGRGKKNLGEERAWRIPLLVPNTAAKAAPYTCTLFG